MASLSKNEIKFIRSLHRKKGRKVSASFIIEGVKMIEEALLADAEFIHCLAIDPKMLPDSVDKVKISENEMAQISALSSPSPALAVISSEVGGWLNTDHKPPGMILALDGISDPGNLGAIIRTADWFGIKDIIASAETVDVLNPKVVQATMGSLFRVRFEQVDLIQKLSVLKDDNPAFKIFTSSLEGKNLDALKTAPEYAALIIGSEAHGVSDNLKNISDDLLKIPGWGGAESLNVAIAAGVLLFAWRSA
ncbi:MAG: RNA methyltransferase [Salibacteraceae bacterium]